MQLHLSSQDNDTVPECGGDFRVVGMIPPKRFRVHPAVFVVFWTLLLPLPAIVNVDRLRQQQVLRNLVSNATKYGGPHIHLRGRVEGQWYRWTVADDGDGVPPELEERLFQRFIHQHSFQQAVAGGVGLGLSIVKSLAEGMGGSVGYERDPEEVRFIIRVPLAAEQPDLRETGGWATEGAA